MQLRRAVLAGLCAFGLAGLAVAPLAGAQSYPAKPVRLVVPFAPGGTTDIVGRAVAQGLTEQLGQQFIVENVPGAATMTGAQKVAASPPDGHTLLVATSTTFSTNPHLYKKIAYRMADFAPVSMLMKYPQVFSVGPGLPVKTLAEFVASAKKSDPVHYGTSGLGGIAHVAGALVAKTLGIQLIDVPYKGSAPVMADLMGGTLKAAVDGSPTSLPLHRAGKITTLAVMGEQRAEAAPEVPTFVESGYPDVVSYVLIGLFAPAGTPADVIDKLNGALRVVLSNEALKARFRPDGLIAEWTTPAQELKAFDDDYRMVGRLIKDMNIVIQ